MTYTLAQVRSFLTASEYREREALAVQFALLLTATRGGNAEIKSLLRDLRP